jgi:hypothetical protein
VTKLLARPVSPLSFRFDLSEEGAWRGWVRHRLFRPSGEAEIDGAVLLIERVAMHTWTIGGVSGELARVQRSGPLRSSWDLSWPGGEVEVKTPLLASKTALLFGSELVGSIRAKNPLSRALVIDASELIPLPALVLAIWIAIRRRRQAAGAAAGG